MLVCSGARQNDSSGLPRAPRRTHRPCAAPSASPPAPCGTRCPPSRARSSSSAPQPHGVPAASLGRALAGQPFVAPDRTPLAASRSTRSASSRDRRGVSSPQIVARTGCGIAGDSMPTLMADLATSIEWCEVHTNCMIHTSYMMLSCHAQTMRQAGAPSHRRRRPRRVRRGPPPSPALHCGS